MFPTLKSLKQEDCCEFRASLSHIEWASLGYKTKTLKKKTRTTTTYPKNNKQNPNY